MVLSRKLLVASTLALTLTAFGQEKKIDRSALPAAVEKTVQAQSEGAVIKGFTTEREHGTRVYEAEMMVSGHSKDIEIASDGTLNEIEEGVVFDSLPASVRAALTKKAAGAKITRVESLTKHGKLVAYEAGILKGTRHGEIQVGPEGQTMAHEE
ncbi:hypothetical protein [Edaphobacter sp.]|uniref:hypothetical protein n=1 Tax=Edaphobacter sp. TaxID=1934404 RepID=UPI002DBF74BC|nr:hypothetical protein [Edaphobacter sp.]HEU5341278.1 hypothetical protein [Edaphobacter sp.]